jgi:hypothetical protein
MATFHFLNVDEGDCSLIQHNSGHISVIDVCNARQETLEESVRAAQVLRLAEKGVYGNSLLSKNGGDWPRAWCKSLITGDRTLATRYLAS